MKALTTLLLSIFLVSPADELQLSVKEGLVLTKTFDQGFELALESTEFSVDGEEQEVPDIELKLTESEHVVITEEVLAADDGKATQVRRTFDELTGRSGQGIVTPDGEEIEEGRDSASELEGLTVLFDWDADDEDWSTAYDDEDGDEDLLDDLEADTNLAFLLPDDEVDEDDSWEVSLEHFKGITAPGGDMHFVDEGEEEDSDEDEFSDTFHENLEGKIECTYAGTREEDGVEVSVIKVALELETRVPQDGEMDIPGAEGTFEQVYEFTFEMEGELLWNTEAGHAVSLELKGPMTLEIDTTRALEGPEGSVELENVQSFEGEAYFTFSME